LETEKAQREELMTEIQELETENTDLTQKGEKSSQLVQTLIKEHKELSDSVDALKEKVQQQKVLVHDLQQEKQKMLTEKTQLVIEIQELTSKISMSLAREKDLKASLVNYESHANDEALSNATLLEQCKTQAATEKASREALTQKRAGLQEALAALNADLAKTTAEVEAEGKAQRETLEKTRELRAAFDVRSSELRAMEEEARELKSKADSAGKTVKDLTHQKQKEEEKTAALARTLAELEQSHEETSKKLAELTAQHDKLMQEKKKEEPEPDTRVDSTGSTEILVMKDSMAKTITSLKIKHDTETRHALELEERLTRMQKEKATSELEKTQVEKELTHEKEKRRALEERTNKAGTALEDMKKTSILDLGQIEELAQKIEQLEALLKEKEKNHVELQANIDELKHALEAIEVEQENVKAVSHLLLSLFLYFFFFSSFFHFSSSFLTNVETPRRPKI